MTGRERIGALLSGGTPDHLPLMPITMMFAADQIGANYRDYARDHRVLAEAQLRTAARFDLDYVSAISDPAREASDLGAEVEWFDNQPPAIVESRALLSDKCRLARSASHLRQDAPTLRRDGGRRPGYRRLGFHGPARRGPGGDGAGPGAARQYRSRARDARWHARVDRSGTGGVSSPGRSPLHR